MLIDNIVSLLQLTLTAKDINDIYSIDKQSTKKAIAVKLTFYLMKQDTIKKCSLLKGTVQAYLLINNLLQSFDITQVINLPTRIDPTGFKLIDIIACSNKIKVKNPIVINCSFFTDHCLLACDLGSQKDKMKPFFPESRDFKHFKQLYLRFVKFYFLSDTFNRHAPMRSFRVSKKNAPWLTDTLKIRMRLRDNAFKRYKKTKSCHKYVYHKDLKNCNRPKVVLSIKATFTESQLHLVYYVEAVAFGAQLAAKSRKVFSTSFEKRQTTTARLEAPRYLCRPADSAYVKNGCYQQASLDQGSRTFLVSTFLTF
nr:unnamed protein product [Callosobruchus analis]